MEKETYYGYIYLTLDQKHNKIYVGKKNGRPEDSNDYFGSGRIISSIIKVRGTYFLQKYIIGLCNTREELNKSEVECISFFNSANFLYGYNLSDGGEGGNLLKYLSDTKKSERGKKISNWHKGKFVSEETKNKIRQAKDTIRGKTFEEIHGKYKSIEILKKISKNVSGENNGMFGKRHTAEAKQKMSKNRKSIAKEDHPCYKKIDIEYLIECSLQKSPYLFNNDIEKIFNLTFALLKQRIEKYDINIYNQIIVYRKKRSNWRL